MKQTHRAVRVLSAVLETFVTLCFSVILALTIVLVVLRYVFNASIMGGNELMEYLFIYTTAVGAAVAMVRREHIRITWFIEKLPPKGRSIVEAVAYLLIGFINAVMIRYSIPWIRAVGAFQSPVLRLPNRTIQLIVPIGCGLVIVFCLYHAVLALCSATANAARRTE